MQQRRFINKMNSSGETALGLAIYLGQSDAALELLKAEADPFVTLTINTVKTPFDLACEYQLKEVLDFIKSKYKDRLTPEQKEKTICARSNSPKQINVNQRESFKQLMTSFQLILSTVKNSGKAVLDQPRCGMEILYGRLV